MGSRAYNILFLCTGNSARSIVAESLANALSGGRLRAFSAGSHPTGRLNPLVLDYLREQGVPAEGARSKSWEEFASPGAPAMDFIVTVCDSAAGEACPVWPGHPVTAHWGVPDPAAHMHDPAKAREVTGEVFRVTRGRLEQLLALPLDSLDRDGIRQNLRRIGGS